jgi:iron complex transport system substrate-binding protein
MRVRLAVVLASTLAGCTKPSPPPANTVVDDARDTVAVRVPAHRIVSLIPATTELLFAIGAGDRVVGRSAWCDYPAEAKQVPNLGDGINPNVEAILATRPDLVVLYNSAQHAGVAARLRSLGIPTLRINTDALADVGRVGRLLGRLTGRTRSADSIAAVFDTALAAATVDSRSGRRPTVLLLVWEQPPMTIGHGSFLSELVERAGGANLFDDVTASAGPVSIEAVAARDPDFIFTTTDGPSTFARRPEWQVVRAVREHRFIRVTGSEFNRPGPRSPAAIRELAARLRAVAR